MGRKAKYISVQPGEVVGDAGMVFLEWAENGNAKFRHLDGHEAIHSFAKVAAGKIRGYRLPAKRYEVGEQVGQFGLVLASEPVKGRAKFRYPNGHHKIHRVIAVENGTVTGRKRGRPTGVKNNRASLGQRYDWQSLPAGELKQIRKANDERRQERNNNLREWRRKREGI